MPRKKGFKHTEETKNKISMSHFGIKPTAETRKKLSLSHIGKNIREKNGNWKGYEVDGRTRIRYAPRPKPDRCESCGAIEKIVLDHNHTTHKFRGWLCNGCNKSLGFAKDNTEILRNLINYLNKNNK